MWRRRVVALMTVAIATTGITGCDDGVDQSADRVERASTANASTSGGNSSEPAIVVATPEKVSPGSTVELTFPNETGRGVPWYMFPATHDGWATEWAYLLIAAADGYDCTPAREPPGCPTWYEHGARGGGWPDVPISGPGPDTVLIPETAEEGTYRLCTANTGDVTYCVRIEVDGVDSAQSDDRD